MAKTKVTKHAARRWLFHGILSDTPISEEDNYYPAEYLQKLLKVSNYPGIRILSLKVQELPERPKKTPKSGVKTEEKED